ncbi:MAG: hypothetical protein CMD15_07180 [Flavobacteriales bacterium]|nr:hypothetical protein [Flavobacteriales bacterium]|tara:strand:+ start:11138 stop:12343 length:1206 start_codon:yes stop_codon:yes gene_type:complete
MNLFKHIAFFLVVFCFSCTDPDVLGLEVQPESDNILIFNSLSSDFQTEIESEDSLRTDNVVSLTLGEIHDPIFGLNSAGFYTQLLLTENNIDLGTNPIVDSVILSYTYSGSYGDMSQFDNISVQRIFTDLHNDSMYYSNTFQLAASNVYNVEEYTISESSNNPNIRIKLTNEFGQQIIDLGSELLVDNETFLSQFQGLSLSAFGSNAMLYLNPNGSESYFKIYYKNDENISDTLSLDFQVGGDAARVNIFNEKSSENIIQDISKIYIQSMAGYKAKISFNNIDSLRVLLHNQVINKATIEFNVLDGSQSEYLAHNKLVLVRTNSAGENIFLSDFLLEGDDYFGGDLNNEKYQFNITRYLYQLLTNPDYTPELYLLSGGGAVNANRTLLEKEVLLKIYYSEL